MKDKINFSILLCREADDELTSIQDIFNTIKIGDENKLSFDVVTLINGKTEESSINLVYAIEQLDNESHNPEERQATIFKCLSLEKSNQDANNNGTERLGSENRMEFNAVQHINGMYFPGRGSYEFQIYKYSNEEIDKITSGGDSINFVDLDKEHLECAYLFEIL